MHKAKISGQAMLVTVMALLMAMVLAACGETATPAATSAAASTTAAMTSVAAMTTSVATTSAAVATTSAVATTTSAAVATTSAAVATTTSAAVATTSAAVATTSAAASPAAGGASVTTFNITVPANLKTGPGIDTATKTITVGGIGALSGPVAAAGKLLIRGSEVYFKALNDAGGIGGYKVNFVTGDSQYSPQLAVQQYSKLAPDVAIIGQVIGAPSAAALKDQAASDKVMFLAATGDSSVLGYKYAFTTAIPYPLETINGIDYAVNQLNKKGSKFAIVYQDDAYGQDCLKGYKAAIQAYGLQDVGQIPFKVTDKDFTAQATQLKNTGAEVVWMASQPTQTAAIMGAATQLGVAPQWMLQSAAFSSQLLATPIKDVLLKAYVASYGVAWGDPNAPNEATKIAAIAKYAPDQKPDSYFSAGWAYGIVVTNILAKALSNGDISRDGILAAFESLKNIDLGQGPGQPLFSYGSAANDRAPFRTSVIFKVDANDVAGYSPVTKPFTSEAAKNYKFS